MPAPIVLRKFLREVMGFTDLWIYDLRFSIEEFLDAIAYQAKKSPDGIEEGCRHEHIQDGSPQFADGRLVVDDGIDVERSGNQKTNCQRNQFNAYAAV